jgi:hypothetical protein
MFEKVALLAVGLLFISGVALADAKKETKVASGTVKEVQADSLTIQQGAAEFRFAVSDTTKVVAKGASTKTAKAKKEGKSLTVSDLIQTDQRVMVRYEEDGEELKAVEVRLLS